MDQAQVENSFIDILLYWHLDTWLSIKAVQV